MNATEAFQILTAEMIKYELVNEKFSSTYLMHLWSCWRRLVFIMTLSLTGVNDFKKLERLKIITMSRIISCVSAVFIVQFVEALPD